MLWKSRNACSVMTMDIREKTGIIIEKDGEYLVGVVVLNGQLRWSQSPWDAWITRRRDHAEMVAEKVNGTKDLFNPISGELRKYGGK